MAFLLTQNFDLKSQVPNFERDQFKTRAAMKAYPETALDEGHLSYCVETGKTYQYKSANAADADTGKWREFLPEDVDLSAYATAAEVAAAVKAAVDPVSEAAAAAKTAADAADKGATLLFSGVVEGALTPEITGTTEEGEVVFSAVLKTFLLRIAQPGLIGQAASFKYYAAWPGSSVYNTSDESRTHIFQHGTELYVRDADGLHLVKPDLSAYATKTETDQKIANAKAKALTAAANATAATVKLRLADGTELTATLTGATDKAAGLMTAAQAQKLTEAGDKLDSLEVFVTDNAANISNLQQAVAQLQTQVKAAETNFE